MVGGYDDEMHWARTKEYPASSGLWQGEPGHRVTADTHAPSADKKGKEKGHEKGKMNRTYFSTSPPGRQVFRMPDRPFQRGQMFCYFPFDYETA